MSRTPESLVYALGSWAPTIQGGWFDGGGVFKRAARYQNCRGGEFSNNTVAATTEGVFDVIGDSHSVVEFCNHDLVETACRVAGDALFSLSRGVVQPYRVASPLSSTAGYEDGAFLWVESTSKLMVKVGNEWKEVVAS